MSKNDFKFGLKICMVVGLLITAITSFFPNQEISQNECKKLVNHSSCPGINHKVSGFPLWVRHTWEQNTYTSSSNEFSTKTTWRSLAVGQIEHYISVPRDVFIFISFNYISITSFLVVGWYIIYRFKIYTDPTL